jgi:predicted helicase
MPVNTTAPVTARDHFVVAFTREELEHRIAEFRDLSIPDDVIRERYFTRTRSRRYQRGDTRSWKLAAARQAVAADEDWQAKIVRCLYRPFDWRFVFWHPAMIDWPRSEVTRLLMEGQGVRSQESGVNIDAPLAPSPQPLFPLCLLARRQQLSSQPCTYFWISDGLALDGVIRSDNRGSESLFPMWSDRPDRTGIADDGELRMTPNFNTNFLAELAALIGISPQPLDLLAYIYALFHSSTYRERYAAELRTDFPRILLPGNGELFSMLVGLGRLLIDRHLLRAGGWNLSPNGSIQNDKLPPPKDFRPKNFRVGGYEVLRKWLQPKHRSSDDPEFQRIVAAIDETIELMRAIDAAITQHGGFPVAFERAGCSATPLPRPGGALRAAPAGPSSPTSTT